MRNCDLIHRLCNLDPNVEVEVWVEGKPLKIKDVYIGNEGFVPGGRKDQPNKGYIDVSN